MKNFKKGIAAALALCMSLSIFAGCSGENSTQNSPSPSAENSGDFASKEKVKISMVMCDAGLACPDGIDPSNNDWSNKIAEMANVELTIEQPSYSDYDQKLQLRIAGNDLPDIVHAIGNSHSTTAKEAALDGAFVDLTDYYKNSVNVKNVITEQMMEWSKAEDGKNYYVPMRYQGLPQGTWLIARWDLVEKYNNGKWPETTPEWIALFEKIKQEDPESMVLSNRLIKGAFAMTYGGRVIYTLYGLPGTTGGEVKWDYENQKFENEFVTPEYKAATNVLRDLYAKGVLDKEFATTEKWDDNKKTKNIVAEANNVSQVQLTRPNYPDYPEGNTQEWRAAAPLKEFPEEVRYPEVAYGTQTSGVTTHSIYISAQSKNPDRAWDVLEVMASEEFRDFCVWGKEGYSYTVENGEKVPVLEVAQLDSKDPNSFRWQRQYLLIWGYPSSRPYDEAVAKLQDEEFANEQIASAKAIEEKASSVAMSPAMLPYTPSQNESRKSAEALSSMSTTTINYIMGKMTEEDFDKAVAEWQANYGFMAEERTEYVNSYDKEKAAALGVKYTLD